MRQQSALAVVIAVVAAMSVPNTAGAATTVSGTITSDTTWTRAGSPYEMTGDVTVQHGAKLTIEPGVEIFGQGALFVHAHTGADLWADGTAADPIIFGGSRGFGGIVIRGDDLNFISASNSIVNHVVVSNATYTGLQLSRVSVPISDSVFSDNGFTGLHVFVNSVTITDSVFRDNEVHGLSGQAQGRVTVTGSAFYNNNWTSIHLWSAELGRTHPNDPAWDIHGNDFLRGPPQLGRYDIAVYGNTAATSESYDASRNWWGTTDATEIESRIRDGKDDPKEKVVTWDPPSSSPNTSFNPTQPGPPPSPSASPSSAPSSPPPAPRTISLVLRRHLVARGVISSADHSCLSAAVVVVELSKGGSWQALRRVEAAENGSYRMRLSDRRGRYRARIARTMGCAAATSMVRRHLH